MNVSLFITSTVAATAALACCSAFAQTVTLETSMGVVTLELEPTKAPLTVENFVQYVKQGHYDGTIFHRVIGTFMIQGGGFDANMTEKPTRSPIRLESRNGLSNQRGTIAMARTMVPDSATAQFFINVENNIRLDAVNAPDGNGYAVFGRVVGGMDVVDKIRGVKVSNRAEHANVPDTPVVIRRAKVVRDAPPDPNREETLRKLQAEAAETNQQRNRNAIGDRR